MTPSRRSVVRTAGVLALTALAGCSWVPELGGGPSRRSSVDTEFEYDEYVNVEVARRERDLDTVDSLIQEAADGTLLYFPPGEYLLGESVIVEGRRNLLLVGEGATLKPTGPVREGREYLVSIIGSQIHFEGFTLDYTEAGHGGRLQIITSGDFVCRDVEVVGENAASGLFAFEVRDGDGSGLVEKVVAVDGGPTSVGLFVKKGHTGTMRIVDCQLERFKGNGVYASAPGMPDGGNGTVSVEGGVFRNNNIANVRLGSDGSSVRGALVAVDEEVPPLPDGTVNSRGIWLHGGTDVLVEDCLVLLGAPARGDGALVVGGDTGATRIRNTRIRIDADLSALDISLDDRAGDDVRLDCDGLTITGQAAGGAAVSVSDRDECRFTDLAIDQPGLRRDGFLFRRSTMNVVTGLDIEVTGEPFVLQDDSTVRVVIGGSTQVLP